VTNCWVLIKITIENESSWLQLFAWIWPIYSLRSFIRRNQTIFRIADLLNIAIICMNLTYIFSSIIYQAKSDNIQNSWLTEYDFKEQFCFFAFFATDWTNDELIYFWLTIVFDRNTRLKVRNFRDYHLLFIDEHDNHINMKFLDWCKQNKMLMTLYSSHSTHHLQSLNVSLFNSLINYYLQNLNDWIFKSQELSWISKRDFFDLFWFSHQAAFTSVNIKSEWKRWNCSLSIHYRS